MISDIYAFYRFFVNLDVKIWEDGCQKDGCVTRDSLIIYCNDMRRPFLKLMITFTNDAIPKADEIFPAGSDLLHSS